MTPPRGNLIIGGRYFNVDAPVVNFHDNGWDASSPYCIPNKADPAPVCSAAPGGGQYPHGPPPLPYTRRYSYRPGLGPNPKPEAVQQTIKQFVLHHDGCTSADMCFNVLQNERGLSCHFLLDNDGTIYQTIDLGLAAWHAADWNLYSIGIEMCNRGDAVASPGVYDSGRFGPKRGTELCKINGNTIKSYEYTAAQKEALERLAKELLRIFPNLPAEYPQSSPGEQVWNTLPNANIERERYAGYVGHYHLTAQKWDPGPFNFKDFCAKLRGAFCFPVFPKLAAKPNQDKPVVPDDSGELRQDVKDLYALNESRADGGFFPVGPWGENRLWHGGIHVVGKQDAGVFAPFPGRLVAARMGKDSPIGSCNFVLLRHEMSLGPTKVQFYSLYMHLADELTRQTPVDWMTKDGWKKTAKPGQVALLDEPIEAGALIGHVGKVGPAELSRYQIHVEFFSENNLGDPWILVDGSSSGRFCDAPEIDKLIDKNNDGLLSRQELSDFFASGGGDQLHQMVTLHVSEWTFEPSWADALAGPKDFKPAEIKTMVDEQITPGLWWDPQVAAHCRLPRDGVVYHYHPVAFISWFKTKLIEAAVVAQRTGAHKLNEKDAKVVPKTVFDDLGDKAGVSMRSAADLTEDPCNKNLDLGQMVQGYEAPECNQ